MRVINKKDTFGLINKLKSHTKLITDEIQNKFLPVLYTGRIFKTKQYHYIDKWFVYAASVDEPEKTFSVIQIDNLPYKNIGLKESRKSFCYPLSKMVYDNNIMPILLFINNKFVPWDCIEVIHDFSNSYFKVYGERFNYNYIKDIKMYTLPYNISYLGLESDYLFDCNFEAIHAYINENSKINDKLEIFANLPLLNTEYYYKNHIYSIGYWMYRQIILKEMNLLPKYRVEKLRAISIASNVLDQNGNPEKTITTTINVFDRDSYDEVQKQIFSKSMGGSKILSFNEDGRLVDDGMFNLYLVDENEISIDAKSFDGNEYYGINEEFHNVLNRNNFIVFEDGELCNDCVLNIGVNNSYYINTNKESTKCNVFIFYNKDVEDCIMHKDMFIDKQYLYSVTDDKFKNVSNLGYEDNVCNTLDFEIKSTRLYEDNFTDALEKTIAFNPILLDDIYDRNLYCKTMTGEELNELFVTFNKMEGIKIPRMGYDDHETYCIIMKNGELIPEYHNIIVTHNYLFLPLENKFNPTDRVEFVYFINVNNNEIEFTYNSEEFNKIYQDPSKNRKFANLIDIDDLKLFSTDVKDLLVYPDTEITDNISFPVYKRNEDHQLELIDDSLIGKKMTAVSSRKFIYQRLFVDQKAYRIRLSNHFRYCDNQRQYFFFINGRKVDNASFLITIPKVSRPFDAMYIYTSIFVYPDDRIDLFYLPNEYYDINYNNQFTINENGYIETKSKLLDFPLTLDNYLFFINGKKINQNDIINVSVDTVRLSVDQHSMNRLQIVPINTNYIKEVSDFIRNSESDYESLINYIKNDDSLGYDELDRLFKSYIKLSNIEELVRPQVGKIGIINEIVRDFWVTLGYDYNTKPFVYDYELDDFITMDDNGNYIIPAMDALPEININKDDLHTLYFQFMEDMPDYFEYGYTIDNPLLIWEYNDIEKPDIEYQKINGENIDVNLREYRVARIIGSDEKIILKASNGFTTCSSTIDIKFANGIYYGLVDEDLLDNKESDIYHDNPSQLLRDITKVIKPTVKLDLIDYIIGNNNYFIFAAPKRLIYDENGKFKISFYLPDVDLSKYMDDNTAPILTNGEYDSENNLFVGMDKLGMELMTEFLYTNEYGFEEEYVIFKTNGFFTRNLQNEKFNIYIR